MAFAKKTLAVVLMLLALFEVSLGAVHKVGDSDGWTMVNVDYNKWSSSRNFQVGDSLLFQYNNQFHDVEQVLTLQEFQSCDVTSSVATYISGSDSVSLNRAGHYYFLCGIPGHCQAGQKLNVLVTPHSLGPIASPTAGPHSSAAPSGLPKDTVETTSPAQSGAPSLYMPLILTAISAVAFYVSVFAY